MKDTITVGGITIDIDIDSDSIPVTADFNPLDSEFDDQLNELIDTTDNILNDLRIPVDYVIFMINRLTKDLFLYFAYSNEKYNPNADAYSKLVSPLDKLDVLKDYDIRQNSYPAVLAAWDHARYIVFENDFSVIINYPAAFRKYCKRGAVGQLTYQAAIDCIKHEVETFIWGSGFEQESRKMLNLIRDYKTTLKTALEEIYPVIEQVDAEKTEQIRKIYQRLEEQLAYELIFAMPRL